LETQNFGILRADDDCGPVMYIEGATIVTQRLLAAYNAFVDDLPTRLEKRRSKKHK
jgi:hypothetical protein